MGTICKATLITEQQGQWSKAPIQRGKFTNDSECIRDQDSVQFQALKAAMQEELETGGTS